MPTRIDFPDIDPRWIFDRDCIAFLALVDEKPVRCIISMEALYQDYGARDSSEKECLRAFREHRREIEQEAVSRIRAGAATPERDVMIQSKVNRLLHFIPSAEIANRPELKQLLFDVTSRYIGRFATHGFDTRVYWDFAGQPERNLFQVTLEASDSEGSTVDWFSFEQLKNPDYLRRRFDVLWAEYLSARSKKLLEKVRAD